MRILTLTDSLAAKLLARRRRTDVAAERVAGKIVDDVRRRGDAALFAWTRRLDGLRLASQTLHLGTAERRAGARRVAPSLRAALEHAARNIRRVAEAQRPRPWSLEVEPGVRVSQRVEPLDTIGCYVPGGRFSLVSTLLMTAIPARVVGVRRIVAACPRPNDALLAAAELAGVDEILRIGGAQAVAAMAYGTRSVPRVDKIFGPGNRYVTAAKQRVSADCAIDMLAGPTEVLILATREPLGRASYIAADLLAQAEHDPDAVAILVTTSRPLARAVRDEAARQLAGLPATNPAHRSLPANGLILLAPNATAAARFANRFAPEHLSLPAAEPALLRQLDSAGSIFLGPFSAQPFGDYASGTNHVLPTGAGARARGGLSAWDFVRCTTAQQITKGGLRRLAPVASALADAEGLLAHRLAVEARDGVRLAVSKSRGGAPARAEVRS